MGTVFILRIITDSTDHYRRDSYAAQPSFEFEPLQPQQFIAFILQKLFPKLLLQKFVFQEFVFPELFWQFFQKKQFRQFKALFPFFGFLRQIFLRKLRIRKQEKCGHRSWNAFRTGNDGLFCPQQQTGQDIRRPFCAFLFHA